MTWWSRPRKALGRASAPHHQHLLYPAGGRRPLHVDEALRLAPDDDQLFPLAECSNHLRAIIRLSEQLHVRDLRHDDIACGENGAGDGLPGGLLTERPHVALQAWIVADSGDDLVVVVHEGRRDDFALVRVAVAAHRGARAAAEEQTAQAQVGLASAAFGRSNLD